MKKLKRSLSVFVAVFLIFALTPVTAIAAEIAQDVQNRTFTYENDEISVKAKASPGTVFTKDEEEVDIAQVRLAASTDGSDVFAELCDGYEGTIKTVDLSFCLKGGDLVEQSAGSTTLTMVFPEDEQSVIEDVEVYRSARGEDGELGNVKKVKDIDVDSEDHTVTFEAGGSGSLGAFAVRYTVAAPEEPEQSEEPEDKVASEKPEKPKVSGENVDSGTVSETAGGKAADTKDSGTVSGTAGGEAADMKDSGANAAAGSSIALAPKAKGTAKKGATAGTRSYSESSDLAHFMTSWKITVGDTVFSDDNVDENTVIEYKDGKQYSLELNFAERPELGFYAPETNPPYMFWQLPDCFNVPSSLQVPLNVNLGRKGVLPDNIISVFEESGHSYLKLTWNWEDTLHWNYFRDSSQAKLRITVNGTFQDADPNKLSINGKEVAIRKQDLHNAVVNKSGLYNPQTGIIDYTVTVSSDGTTSDITLTDTPGSALLYQGDIEYVSADSVNTAGTVPEITARTGNTFSVVIPSMNDKDSLVFRYSAKVNYNAIAVSGNPSFEETGNTAQIFGDSYTLDNTAVYHESNIEFSDLEKNVLSKRSEYINGNFSYILKWEIETNKRAQFPLADTEITDTISPNIQSFSKYYGDGLTVKCYAATGELADTRFISWSDLGVDLANDTTWTYHIPDTDPNYRYVLTYDTIVDMSAQTETVVAENTAEGKGGIDSDRAVLTLPGKGGISVSKKAVNVDSTHVTWEIKMTVSGGSLNSQRLVLAEHSGSKTVKDANGNSQTTWNSDYMPGRWFEVIPGANNERKWYKETLEKVEVIGLEGDETYKVTYGYNSSGTLYASDFYCDIPGQSVMEKDFASKTTKWQPDYFRLEFYKDFEKTQGGLINPGGEEPSRTLTIRLTTTFPEEWAALARASMLNSNKMESSNFTHINWIDVQTPDNNGALKTRAYDTDKIEPMPPNLYKMAIDFTDTTLATTSQMQKWPLNFPDVIYKSNYNNLSYSEAEHGELPVFPAFRYQILVTGIKYDEPLVIEDSFDTSKFALLTKDNVGGGGGGLITYKSKNYTQNLVMRVAGSRFFGAFPAGNANFYRTDDNSLTYSFGIRNSGYTDLAEDHGCELELTDTGFRVTINELFRDNSGNLYPNYGVEYYLVPKNLEALREIEEMARANGKAGLEPKAPFTNKATCRGLTASATVKYGITNDFMPIDKTSETYLKLVNPYNGQYEIKLEDKANGQNQTIRDTPDGIKADDILNYVMRYRVVLNKGKERLNDGNDMVAEDEYSSNLSVDFSSIKITTEPAAAASKVSYDYSGNIGSFTIPDETKVTIEYNAVILNTAAGNVNTSNEVRLLQYKKTLNDIVDHAGAGGSSATNPSILVKKYGSGHMEKGLNGAQFQLFTYNHETYTNGDPNTAADWTPVVLTKPDVHDAIFETRNLTVDETEYGDGYAEIELSMDRDGMTLQPGKVYGLREIETPVGTAPNGDTINYLKPHNDNFYCYIFSICEDGQTANYNNYVFLPDDTMTVRNTPESLSLHMSKELSGNCTLADTEKNELSYQVFRKKVPSGATEAVYMPIMTTVTDPGTNNEKEIIDPRFTNIGYSKLAESSGMELTGLVVESGTTVGEYLLVEYGNDAILRAHPDWSWRGSYKWSDGGTGSFTNTAYTVYDEAGGNPQTVKGVPFTVTSQEIRDGDNKSVVLTNSYSKQVVDLTANKRWTGPSGTTISWPAGKKVTFTLGTLDGNDQFTALSGVDPIELDNKTDANGEAEPGKAVFRNLPKYQVDQGVLTPIRYAVKETSTITGYDVVYPVSGQSYAAFGSDTTVTIKNQVKSTSISVSKAWDKNNVPTAAEVLFRLYSYPTGSTAADAVWVSNVNDIRLDGVPGPEFGTNFGEVTGWQADFTGLPMYDSDGNLLIYIVKEIAATPAGYEPVQDYAAAGGTITNKPASTIFSVTKRWSGTPGNAWPDGERIRLQLKRKVRGTEDVDSGFSPSYLVSSSTIVSQDLISDPYGDNCQAGTWASGTHTLTVSDLPKYNENGKEWLYYVKETAVESSDGTDLSGNYSIGYRDKNNYGVSGGMTYSGGSITNTRSTKQLSVSKQVAGSMGDKGTEFQFTVSFTQQNNAPYKEDIAYTKTTSSTTSSNVTTGTLSLTGGSGSFSLMHGESIVFEDLPGNLSYTVTESDSVAPDYTTTYTVNGGASNNGRIATGPLTDNPDVAFTNTRDGVVNTGIKENALLWLLFALVPAAYLAFYLRRHRRDRRGA